MEFDLALLGDYLPDPITQRYNETQVERFQMWIDLAVQAEHLGYTGVWLGEHHCSDYIISSPQMVLAAIASRTRKIRLGTAVSLLPNTDPVRMAEDFATLDLISHGRAEIGFGSGITEHTFRLFGQSPETAAERGRENLELLLALWNEERIDWEGKFRSPIHDSRIEPRTLSGRQLPINRATATSTATAAESGKAGFRLMVLANLSGFVAARPVADAYREAYQKAGHDPKGMIVAAPIFTYVGRDGSAAKTHWKPYMANYKAFVSGLAQSKGATQSIRIAMSSMEHSDEPITAKDMIGAPAEIAEKIQQADFDIGGLDRAMCQVDLGGLSRGDVFASVELFAQEVIPAVNAKSPARVERVSAAA